MRDPDVADRPTIRIDDQPIRALGAEMTGAELLSLAGADPAEVDLVAEGHRGQRIAPEDTVPVQEGSRFRTRRRA